LKVVVQRVKSASVQVEGEVVGSIAKGLLLLVGIAETDRHEDLDFVAKKCVELRIFQDEEEKMNRSLLDVNGDILSISQFTLLGDTRKGRRPSFVNAAGPEKAEAFYHYFNEQLSARGVRVEKGIFGAMMDVALVNEGPVTIIVESKKGST
jgi:D-tyrosyl-tRNA(Tyr) deacylase